MSIETVEIESVHGSAKRLVFYKAQDHLGVWHQWGPVITSDPDWDEEAYKTIVAQKLEDKLADQEASRLLEE